MTVARLDIMRIMHRGLNRGEPDPAPHTPGGNLDRLALMFRSTMDVF